MPNPLSAFGWDEQISALFSLVDAPGHQPGRVIRTDRGSCLVTVARGTVRASAYALVSRRAGVALDPATGDWVAVVDDPTEGCAIVAILPRRSRISRRDPNEDTVVEQVVAANVDIVAAVCPLDRPFGENRLERFLAMGAESGGKPAVILTKADVADGASDIAALAADLAPGVAVYVTSGVTGDGLDALRSLVAPGLTLVLMGPSGAGKSTLVNRLIDQESQRTEAVRESDGRGRHTTTSRDLIPMPGGGVLLDTPGLRSLGLWDAEQAVAEVFSDIEELGAKCRFRDCSHTREPGCAVMAAVREGTLDTRRLQSYLKLENEVAALDRQKDVRARREAGRKSGRPMPDMEKFNRR